MRRLLYRLEGAFDQAVERAAERAARLRLASVRIDREYLRGHGCHCPAGLPRHFVHSEGLREACDLVVDFGSNVESALRRQVPLELLAHLPSLVRPGDAIHVKADLLPWFVKAALPRLPSPFVLVTGDSDAAVVRQFEWLLEDARVDHWFAQNCDVPYRHPRLTRVPIGLDNPVYTKFIKRLGFALHMALRRSAWDPSLSRNDIGDQARLQDVAAGLPAFEARPLRALCTFQNNSKLVPNAAHIPDRLDAMRQLRDNPSCWFPARRLPQAACWAAHADFAFEVAPHGNGLDSFRLWEALILQTIPIVRRSTLDPLFEDEAFPVALVDSYAEVCPDNLVRWADELKPRFGAGLLDRLSNAYWVNKIRAAKAKLVYSDL
jgi:hypothetical protein